MNVEFCRPGHRLPAVLVVGGLFFCVNSVGEDVGSVGAFGKEGERHLDVAWSPVGECGYIPCVAFASRQHGVFTHFSVNGYCLVKHSRHLCYKVGALLLALVFRRTVGKHL